MKRDELSIFKEITSKLTSDRREYSDKSLHYYQDFYDAFGDNADFMVATFFKITMTIWKVIKRGWELELSKYRLI